MSDYDNLLFLDLIKQFTPLFIFHKYEYSYPVDINNMLSDSSLWEQLPKLKKTRLVRSSCIKGLRDISRPSSHSRVFLKPNIERMKQIVQMPPQSSEIHVSVNPIDNTNGSGLRLTYWICFPSFNKTSMNSIRFRYIHIDLNAMHDPTRIYFSNSAFHYGYFLDWDKTEFRNNRPTVYVSLGSHNFYHKVGFSSGCGGVFKRDVIAESDKIWSPSSISIISQNNNNNDNSHSDWFFYKGSWIESTTVPSPYDYACLKGLESDTQVQFSGKVTSLIPMVSSALVMIIAMTILILYIRKCIKEL